MANKRIPEQDRRLVIQRLAEGQSTRQAIRDTAISSNSTAAQLSKHESHRIAQLRATYLEKIDHYSREPAFNLRACALADMLDATKYVKCDKDRYTRVPDWDTILKAIRYIDMLSGITSSNGMQINVLQQQNYT